VCIHTLIIIPRSKASLFKAGKSGRKGEGRGKKLIKRKIVEKRNP